MTDRPVMDKRVVLSRPYADKNDFNESVDTLADLDPVWASFEPLSDAEQRRAAEVGATMTARFQVRWSSVVRDLDPRWKVKFDGFVYDVVGVKALGRRDRLEISAVARAEISEATT